MVGEGAAMLIARAFEASGMAQPADALDRYLAFYDARLLRHTRPYDDIVTVLEALAQRATLAVLTNKPLAATRRILDGLDLARFFAADAVLGGDGPFARKPDPAALRHLIAQARVKILPRDDADSLAARVLEEEHRLYPIALDEYCRLLRTEAEDSDDAE